MNDLPHGLTGPLHLLEPFAWRTPALLALALALGALYLFWRRRRRRALPVEAVVLAPPAPPEGVLGDLERLRREHAGAGSFRAGCHDLSRLLRRHLERTRRRPFSRWTAREVASREGDNVWSRLLGLVSELQFGRRPPGDSDFAGLCDLARETLAGDGES